MKGSIAVLSPEEQEQIHQRSLRVLAETGVQVRTEAGRRYFRQAGAEVEEGSQLVRIPPDLVASSLASAPRHFILGARRPGWDLPMNAGECTLLADGEATSVLDPETGKRRPSTHQDWLDITRLIDAIDEIGIYWAMVEGGQREGTPGDLVNYWHQLFAEFSKHIQDPIDHKEQAPLFLEVLQVVFGDRKKIIERHPVSYLLCPQSPLVIDEQYAEAYLALAGWKIPVAIMPMPLCGGTAPGTLMGTIILSNCEVLATLTLVQAADPGTPVIYAPAFSVMNPRTGYYSGGAIENGVLSVAGVQMARYYQLPVEATGLGSDHYIPGVQAAFERAMNALLPLVAAPDILVGPGLLGGAMVFSREQLMIDLEIYRMARRAGQGVGDEDSWLDEVIRDVGPGGNFLAQRSTANAFQSGEKYHPQIGWHDPYQAWQQAGRPALKTSLQKRLDQYLSQREPLPLDEDQVRELEKIQKRAQETQSWSKG